MTTERRTKLVLTLPKGAKINASDFIFNMALYYNMQYWIWSPFIEEKKGEK